MLFLGLTLVVSDCYRKETWPVEVDIGVEKLIIIPLECLSTGLWDIGIA
jgi:hypothetical protein